MATRTMSIIVRHLRRAGLLQDGAGLTDGELLECFLARREEAAFEALVRRHGPMVLGVCRRVLRNAHDADDAFQATFLVLLRKALALLGRETLGNWLYGVAYRTALKARKAMAKRREKEAQVNFLPRPETRMDDTWKELQFLLDQELSRLPDKYREAVVLCNLQGKTRGEAARQLGVPVGTVSGRLTTARRILARRLTRRGLALSGVFLAGLDPNITSACVPVSLVASTVRGATLLTAGPMGAGTISAKVAALSDSVVKAMLLTHVKILTVVMLAVGVAGVGVGVLTQRTPRASDTARDGTARVWGMASSRGTLTFVTSYSVEQEPAKNPGQTEPHWYANAQGQTFVVLPGPIEFPMGLPSAETGPHMRVYPRQIRQTFALAAKAVTREQFERFRPNFSYDRRCCRAGHVLVAELRLNRVFE
jgi:RNA polymerase sigma factor (sigma-70 family)